MSGDSGVMHRLRQGQPPRWVLANVRLQRSGPSVAMVIDNGRIEAMTPQPIDSASPVVDGGGGWLLPGLHDHHMHLFGAAAALSSVRMNPRGVDHPDELIAAVEAHLQRPPISTDHIRITGYRHRDEQWLDRHQLDQLFPVGEVRVQYSTGSLWVFNSAALERLLVGNSERPEGLECDGLGGYTGRLWRGDRWLSQQARTSSVPSLQALSQRLLRYGITAVTDTSYTNDVAQLHVLQSAVSEPGFQQRSELMCAFESAADPAIAGQFSAAKLILDEHRLPDFQSTADAIAQCFDAGRRVAAHCVTEAELVFYLAVLEAAGARDVRGNRIEHGALIPEACIDSIRELDLTVVTQPEFIRSRGDRYLSTVSPDAIQDLYRCGSLLRAGVAVKASSDAPYGDLNPWLGVQAAADRYTARGRRVGEQERVPVEQAVALYSSGHRINVGEVADLCLLKPDWATAPTDPVAMTVINGRIAYQSEG